MNKRIITAFILLSIAIPVIIVGKGIFDMTILILATIGFIEIMKMSNIRIKSPETFLGVIATLSLVLPNHYYSYTKFTPLLILSICSFTLMMIMMFSQNEFSFERVGVVSLSSLYIGLGGHYILAIRNFGLFEIVFVLMMSILNDSGAYFIGKVFGRHKLAPKVSPNKTIEGSIGGVLTAIIASIIFYQFYQPFNLSLILIIVLTIIITIFGQFGDLVESALKRFYHVKDSGNIFPGHGGVLDRFDSIMFAAVACHLFLLLVL